jgi:hypothetical protein
MKYLLIVILLLNFSVGCRHVPPGHDPSGPGNSENAPGHNKDNKHGDGPGNSENAPGQKKKQAY